MGWTSLILESQAQALGSGGGKGRARAGGKEGVAFLGGDQTPLKAGAAVCSEPTGGTTQPATVRNPSRAGAGAQGRDPWVTRKKEETKKKEIQRGEVQKRTAGGGWAGGCWNPALWAR